MEIQLDWGGLTSLIAKIEGGMVVEVRAERRGVTSKSTQEVIKETYTRSNVGFIVTKESNMPGKSQPTHTTVLNALPQYAQELFDADSGSLLVRVRAVQP